MRPKGGCEGPEAAIFTHIGCMGVYLHARVAF
jgi:hypothetical protein